MRILQPRGRQPGRCSVNGRTTIMGDVIERGIDPPIKELVMKRRECGGRHEKRLGRNVQVHEEQGVQLEQYFEAGRRICGEGSRR